MSEQQPTHMAYFGNAEPDEPFVQYARAQCRQCDALQPDWVPADERDRTPWEGVHLDETGHTKFYLWTAGRHTSQIWTFGGGAS